MRRTLAISIIIGSLGIGYGIGCADEPPPVAQLPHDVARLATVWMAMPQSMYRVTRDEGAFAGLTKGAVEGGGRMIGDTVTYLTSGYFHDARSDAHRPAGALVNYSF